MEIVDEEDDGEDYGREEKNERHRHHSGQARPRAGQGSGGRVVSERFQSTIFQKGRETGRARRDEGNGQESWPGWERGELELVECDEGAGSGVEG